MPGKRQQSNSTATAERPNWPHPLTDEERRKGGLVKAQKQRELQEAARQQMIEDLARQMAKATRAVDEALEAEAAVVTKDGSLFEFTDHRTRLSAADRVFDRVAGKPGQSLEVSGDPDRPLVVEHRDKLSLRDALAKVATRRDATASTTT